MYDYGLQLVRPAPKVGRQLPVALLRSYTLIPGTSWSMLAMAMRCEPSLSREEHFQEP
ncbi:protein of unknown function [Petrocella atlantisensis]|uniref:Uncharacterized protein n=1 Tax=Petrocella atlantisensis TaxID=2173034 RepID=A0A3P7P2T9_9FIRM|nr:hypothetical protein [Petrocella atlantisensis]VDN47820.1 protein of unknown function [Petrocella atlantisensis]